MRPYRRLLLVMSLLVWRWPTVCTRSFVSFCLCVCVCLESEPPVCEHVPSVRDHTEYVDVLITRFTLSVSQQGDNSNYSNTHIHMPILTVIILIKKLVSSQDQCIWRKGLRRGDRERWRDSMAARGANKRQSSLDKYHIHITKESIRHSCGHAS